MALNRETKRALQKSGQLAEDGTPKPAANRRAPAARPREERTSLPQWGREVRSELRKVAWPTREEIIRYSIIVFVAIVVVTLFITGVDYVFLKLQHWFFGTGDTTSALGHLASRVGSPGF